MEIFNAWLSNIKNPAHRARSEEILNWVAAAFPALVPKVAWNQPMFTAHGTFIIGFSTARQHLAVAPEKECLDRFAQELRKAGYDYGKQLFRIKWDSPVDYSLLARMIEFNLLDKADCKTFWRK